MAETPSRPAPERASACKAKTHKPSDKAAKPFLVSDGQQVREILVDGPDPSELDD